MLTEDHHTLKTRTSGLEDNTAEARHQRLTRYSREEGKIGEVFARGGQNLFNKRSEKEISSKSILETELGTRIHSFCL